MFTPFSRYLRCLVLLGALFSVPAMAKNYVVEVHGIVCQFCSYGVAKKVRKLDFIDPSQYKQGVRVAIEDQSVYLAVAPGKALDKKALFEAIESGGYQPIRIWSLTDDGDRGEVQP